MPEKKSFILYVDNKAVFDILSDAQLGRLTRLLIDFADTRTLENNIDDAAVNVAYRFMTTQMKRDIEKYELVCQRRSEAGKLGGRPKKQTKANAFSEKQNKANESNEKQTKAKKADNDNVNDNDNDILSLSCDNDNNSQPCTAAGAAAQADNENGIRYGRIIDGYQTIIDDNGNEVIPFDPNDDFWA